MKYGAGHKGTWHTMVYHFTYPYEGEDYQICNHRYVPVTHILTEPDITELIECKKCRETLDLYRYDEDREKLKHAQAERIERRKSREVCK